MRHNKPICHGDVIQKQRDEYDEELRKELEHIASVEASLNASILAKQCDLTRMVETRAMGAEADLERLWRVIIEGLMPRLSFGVPARIFDQSGKATQSRDIEALETALKIETKTKTMKEKP